MNSLQFGGSGPVFQPGISPPNTNSAFVVASTVTVHESVFPVRLPSSEPSTVVVSSAGKAVVPSHSGKENVMSVDDLMYLLLPLKLYRFQTAALMLSAEIRIVTRMIFM